MILRNFKRKFFRYLILEAKKRNSTHFDGVELQLVSHIMKVDLDDTEFLSVLKYLQVKEFIVPKFAQDNSLESLDLTQKGVHYYDNKLEFWKQFALSKISDIIVSTITAILVTIITSYILHIS